MKIREIHIDRFGCFRDHTRAFPPGFAVIGEKNEAGKTTTLEFIRRLFFGFPDGRRAGNRYLPPGMKDSEEFGGSALLELDNGTTLRISRHRSNGKLRLETADGRVNEAADGEFLRLTGLSAEWYSRIYAITLDELTSLSALDSGEIRRRFYGAPLAAAGVSPTRLRRDLEEEAKAIFKQRSANSEIGRLRAEYETLAEEIRKAEAARPRTEEALRRAERLTLEAERAEARRSKLDADCRRAGEELQMLTLLRESEENSARLTRLPALPDVPGDWRSRRAELLETLRCAERGCADDPPPADGDHEIDESVFRRADELLRESLSASRPAPPTAAAALLFAGAAACLFAGTAALFFAVPAFLPGALLTGTLLLAGAGGMLLRRRSLVRRREEATTAAAVEEFRRRYALSADDPAGFGAELRTLRERRERRGRLEEARRALADFDASLGIDGDDAFAALLERREAFLRARSAAESSRRAFERLAGGGENARELRKRLDGTDADALRRDMESWGREAAECARAAAEASHAAGAAREEARLSATGDPAALETRLDGIRGEMRDALRRLLTLHGARRLLDLAIERYERESQPEVIRRAAGDFTAFTGGRYTRCFRSAGSGELTVSDGETGLDKTFELLSRGTREQLMLAMRLALIEAREAGGAESMPVIFDDIGVNFDPERRAAVIGRLRSFAEHRQVFFFTHEQGPGDGRTLP